MTPLMEWQDVFHARTFSQPSAHQTRRSFCQDGFAMEAGVVRVRMTDKHPFRADASIVRVQPKREIGEINPAAMKLEGRRRHALNSSGAKRRCNPATFEWSAGRRAREFETCDFARAWLPALLLRRDQNTAAPIAH